MTITMMSLSVIASNSLAGVVVRITIHCLIELLDLVSDVSGQVQVSLDAVSDLCKQVLRGLVRVVSINDDTSHILTTLAVEEERASISASESPTVRCWSVSVATFKRSDGRRDKPLATE